MCGHVGKKMFPNVFVLLLQVGLQVGQLHVWPYWQEVFPNVLVLLLQVGHATWPMTCVAMLAKLFPNVLALKNTCINWSCLPAKMFSID